MIDPVALAQELIRRPSVTPEDAGALDVLEAALAPLGFVCRRLRFEEPGTDPVDNLYARFGTQAPHFCFAGHTDVVPVGDRAGWTHDPFGGEIAEGRLWGRGAADMKGAVAAFAAAAARVLAGGAPKGSISLLITGDEEGDAVNGTRQMLDWLRAEGETIDACVVGEPTNPNALGDMMKIGRRGSLTGYLTVYGTQGHTAYGHLADNPLPRLARMVAALSDEPFDQGTAHFQPSSLEVTTIDVGNPATNVIPAEGRATFNVRYNDVHDAAAIERELRARLDRVGGRYDLRIKASGEAFVTEPGPLTELVANAVERATGRRPEASTTGGTSDARFIKDACPVVEFGGVGATMHKVDENMRVDDIVALTRIYEDILRGYFAGAPR